MERLDCDRMFVAVVESGSFAKAAVRRGTSSGQASKLVARLEAELGVQLLKRTTRALAATEAGRAYYERIKALLADFDALDASMRDATGIAVGSLRVSVPASFGAGPLAPILAEFARRYEGIRLDVSFTDRLVNVVDEGFDLAVRVGEPTDSSLIGRKLCAGRVVVFASPAYLAAYGEPMRPEALAERECIIDTNFREPLAWRFREAGKNASFTVNVSSRLCFSSAEACIAAAEAHLGIAHGPTFIAGPRLRAGVLRPILREFEPPAAAIYAVYPPGRHLAFKVRALVDFLAEQFRGEPPWDRGW